MLTIALLVDDDTPALEAALPNFAGLATPERPLLLLDLGTEGAGRDAARLFSQRQGAGFLPLDTALSLPEASELARKETGAEYVLALKCNDRVNRRGLETLEQALKSARPDLVVMASGWWLTQPARPLPGPDAARAKPGDLAALYPDPRRLLLRGGQCDAPDAGRDPRAAWAVWDAVTGVARQPLLHSDPVLLRRLPAHGAAPTLSAIATLIAETPRRQRAAALARSLPRLGDALALAPPGAAGDTMTAAAQLLHALPRGLRRAACAATAPTGAFLSAVHKQHTDAVLAHLALLASARSDMQTRALAGEYAALRRDLEAALPGPNYLRDLHTRLRGM